MCRIDGIKRNSARAAGNTSGENTPKDEEGERERWREKKKKKEKKRKRKRGRTERHDA